MDSTTPIKPLLRLKKKLAGSKLLQHLFFHSWLDKVVLTAEPCTRNRHFLHLVHGLFAVQVRLFTASRALRLTHERRLQAQSHCSFLGGQKCSCRSQKINNGNETYKNVYLKTRLCTICKKPLCSNHILYSISAFVAKKPSGLVRTVIYEYKSNQKITVAFPCCRKPTGTVSNEFYSGQNSTENPWTDILAVRATTV